MILSNVDNVDKRLKYKTIKCVYLYNINLILTFMHEYIITVYMVAVHIFARMALGKILDIKG